MKRNIVFGKLLPLLWLVQAMILCQSSRAADVLVSDARIRLPLPGQTSAVAYLSIQNRGASELVLIAVDIEGFSRAELHEHRHEDGMMKMRAVERIALAAGETLEFRPHSYHIMAFGMDGAAALSSKQGYRIKLDFAGGDSVEAVAKVIH